MRACVASSSKSVPFVSFFLDFIGSFLAYFLTRYKNISTQQKEKEDGVIHDDDENDDEVEMRGLQTSRLRM